MTTMDRLLFVILACAITVVIAAWPTRAGRSPCAVAEFAPDVPQHVKDRCRDERRMER